MENSMNQMLLIGTTALAVVAGGLFIWKTNESSRQQDTIKQQKQKIEAHEAELTSIKGQTQKIANLSTVLENLEKENKGLKQDVADYKTLMATLPKEAKEDATNEIINGFKKKLQKTEEEMASNNALIASYQAKIKEIEKSIESTKAEKDAVVDEHKQLQDKVKKAEAVADPDLKNIDTVKENGKNFLPDLKDEHKILMYKYYKLDKKIKDGNSLKSTIVGNPDLEKKLQEELDDLAGQQLALTKEFESKKDKKGNPVKMADVLTVKYTVGGALPSGGATPSMSAVDYIGFLGTQLEALEATPNVIAFRKAENDLKAFGDIKDKTLEIDVEQANLKLKIKNLNECVAKINKDNTTLKGNQEFYNRSIAALENDLKNPTNA